jgi:hypothetical protein
MRSFQQDEDFVLSVLRWRATSALLVVSPFGQQEKGLLSNNTHIEIIIQQDGTMPAAGIQL